MSESARMIAANAGAIFRPRLPGEELSTNHIGTLVHAAEYGGQTGILIDPLTCDSGVIPAGTELELIRRRRDGSCTYRVVR